MLPNFQFPISNFQSIFKFKIILAFSIFLLSTFYFLYTANLAHAVSPSQQPASNQIPPSNTNSDVPHNLHNWTQSVMIEVVSALTCQLVGIDPINPKQACLGADPKTGKIGFVDQSTNPNNPKQIGGAIGVMGNMISMLYTPPIRTGDYFQNLASNFGFTKKAHAQATQTGFQSLSPLLEIWKAFRNIVYIFFVVVFVVIGLAIMLRVKIDPRTVMSVQNQIPKIIIGIVLVTFSFAIAGFLIDLMWIAIYLVYNVISPVSNISHFNPANLQGSNPFGLMGFKNFVTIPFEASRGVGEMIGSLLGGGGGFTDGPGGVAKGITVGAAAGAAVGGLLGSIVPGIGNLVGLAIGSGMGATIGGIFENGIGNTLGFIGGMIAFVIIIIALLFSLFRLWFTLIMAYVQILLAITLAPFWIVGGILPGSSFNVSGWLRELGANLLAFPVTIAMFMLGQVFMNAFGTRAEGQFVPPLIGNPGDTNAIGALIGLGVILMTPNVVNMTKAALKAPKVDVGGALQAIGVGAAIPSNAIKTTTQLATAYKYDITGAKRKDSSGIIGMLQHLLR